jgi:apolipoprotein N-acyltransferase
MKHSIWIEVAFVAAGLGFYYSNDYGWLAWIAPIPVFLISTRLPIKYLFIGAVLSYWAGSMSWWKAESFIFNIPLFLGFHLLYAIVFALLIIWIAKKSSLWIFPLGWTAFEFLVASLSPQGGTWASLAYTQANYLSVMQNVSVFGIYGVIFLVCGFPVTIIYLIRQKSWERLTVVKATLLILCFLLASNWGFIRMKATPEEATIQVALTAADFTLPYEESADSAKNIIFVKDYVSRVKQLKDQGAQVIVLPEKLVQVTQADVQEIESIFSKSALDNQVYLNVGVKLLKADGVHNTAWVYSPSGQKIIEYDKIHLVPILETDFVRGSEMAWFNAFDYKIGTVICKDMDFPSTIRQYGRKQVGLLLVPAWDWKGAERIHSRMAVVRGIENGFAVARSAKEGLVTVSDRYGRILKESSTFVADEATVVTSVAIAPKKTIYSKLGDWLGWLSLIGTLIMLVIAFQKSKSYRIKR